LIKVITCILIITLNPVCVSQPDETSVIINERKVKRLTRPDWLTFVKDCAEYYGVDPYFALAVAEVESSCKGERFRFGKMGKGTYYGPFGIHKQFLKKWPIYDKYVNTEIGIKALARYKNQKKSLMKYNTEFNERYWRSIKRLEKENRKIDIFGGR